MKNHILVERLMRYPIVAAGLVLLIIGVIVLFVRYNEYPDLLSRKASLNNQLSTINRNAVSAVHLSAHLDQLNAYLEEIDSRLMSPTDIAANHREFYQIEMNSGARIVRLEHGIASSEGDGITKPKLENFTSIPYTVIIEGTFSSVVQFMHNLCAGSHFIRVDGFDVSPPGKESPDDLVRMDIKIEVLGRKGA